ncbi:hypothetical protein RJ640_006995 [Escallonia rubra]|uniref:GAG-pre-integrase domain-containing protein n=1 Tax=Escallonia rubra TaxID=112253 RepID=A0AA88R9Z3_9ASTE|nr:hypothetical protein RJ640_006995 [Escallonia rubra]
MTSQPEKVMVEDDLVAEVVDVVEGEPMGSSTVEELSAICATVKLAFKDIDESEKKLVRLGDNKRVQVEGKVNGLCYSILFDDGVCVIEDKKSGQIMACVHMVENMIFPLEVSNVDKKVLVPSERNATNLWHFRYGHLNVRRLKLLSQKGMVHGLPNINTLDELYEGCIFGK